MRELNGAMFRDAAPPVVKPEAGDGGRIIGFYKTRPCTIIRVTDGVVARVVVREDCWNAEYGEYRKKRGAPEEHFTLRPSGRWIRMGQNERGGDELRIGERA